MIGDFLLRGSARAQARAKAMGDTWNREDDLEEIHTA
jgi:hypothetical protein